MLFNELVKCISGYSNIHISKNIETQKVSGIYIDSRACSDNSLFVAYKGENVDSHNFIESAYNNGARFFILNYVPFTLSNKDDIAYIVVRDSRVALALSSKHFYNYNDEVNLVGVTGTNGKTSTTHFINQILINTGNSSGSIGTLGVLANNEKIDMKISASTSPEYVELLDILEHYKLNNIDNCVMEVSSHALELKKVFNLKFRAAVFTNLTQDHLDFHKTMENYFLAKSKLFNMCEIGFANADDDWCEQLVNNTTSNIYTFSIDNDSDFKAYNITVTDTYVEFTVNIKGKPEQFKINVPGKFTVYNLLSAVLVACIAYNIDAEQVRKALNTISGVPGRMQSVHNDKNINVIVDYAHTPDAIENVINSVKEISKGKITTIFGCGGDRDREKRPIMCEIATRLSDYTVITSDNPRTEDPQKIIAEVAMGAVDNSNFTAIIDRKDAIKHAIQNAEENDFVIICGKGHEDYQIIGTEKIDFDDFVVARQILECK